jgi:N-acyl-D-amino-acid deacylase
MGQYDLGEFTIRGAIIVDGNGGEPFVGDIRISGDRIAHIRPPEGTLYDDDVDARGLIAAPGFIDMHVHADSLLAGDGGFEAALSQGVSTVVLGQDGCSFAPASAETLNYMSDYFRPVNGPCPIPADRYLGVSQLLGLYEQSAALNVVYLVPHGNLRSDAVGLEDRPATDDELRSMQLALGEALESGAMGLSAGLEYVPSSFADVRELAALCELVRDYGGIFMCHMRSYGVRAPEAFEEMRLVAQYSGARVHISHLKGPSTALERLLNANAESGCEITFDSYPYTASSTILSAQMLPPELQSGGVEAVLERLGSSRVRASLRTRLDSSVSDFYGRMIVSSVGQSKYEWCAGLSLQVAADRAGEDPTDFACRLLIDCSLNVGIVGLGIGGDGYADANCRSLMRLPGHVAGSDGIYEGQHPHPRGWGSFARYLGVHTGDGKEFSLQEAVTHLAARSADRLGLSDRGRLLADKVADIVVFHPAIIDQATFERPRQLATGVEYLFIGGKAVLSHGQTTGVRSGKVLRRSAA